MNPSIDSLSSFLFVAPELMLCGGAILLFMLSAAARRPRPWQGLLFSLLTAGTAAAALAWLVWYGLGWQGKGMILFDGLVAMDPLGLVFRVHGFSPPPPGGGGEPQAAIASSCVP